MTFHFRLLFKRLSRMIREWGVHPIIPAIGLLIAVTSAIKLYTGDNRVVYVVTAMAIVLPSTLLARQRQNFLSQIYSRKKATAIHVLESVLIASLPLITLLLCHAFMLFGLAALIVLMRSLLPLHSSSLPVVPTPFARWPFEFTRGFRTTWPFFLISVILLTVAIQVDNENLGLFAIALPALLMTTYYTKPEEAYFVWIHKLSPQQFLRHKIKIAVIYAVVTILPIVLLHVYFFPEVSHITLLVLPVGLLWISTALVAKYAHFPSELNLLQGFAVVFTLIFPPIAVLIIPVLYAKAVKNLSSYLHD